MFISADMSIHVVPLLLTTLQKKRNIATEMCGLCDERYSEEVRCAKTIQLKETNGNWRNDIIDVKRETEVNIDNFRYQLHQTSATKNTTSNNSCSWLATHNDQTSTSISILINSHRTSARLFCLTNSPFLCSCSYAVHFNGFYYRHPPASPRLVAWTLALVMPLFQPISVVTRCWSDFSVFTKPTNRPTFFAAGHNAGLPVHI